MEQHQIIIFMEAMKGSIKDEIDGNGGLGLSEERAMHYFEQAAEGLAYLHSRKPRAIIHRDVKCENLLLTRRNKVKLADFGLSFDLAVNSASVSISLTAPTSFVGTQFFIAPEIIGKMDQPEAYGRRSDVWSLACTLVQMISGEPPYSSLSLVEFLQRSSSTLEDHLKYSGDLLLPNAGISIKMLLNCLFVADYKDRPFAKDIPALVHICRNSSIRHLIPNNGWTLQNNPFHYLNDDTKGIKLVSLPYLYHSSNTTSAVVEELVIGSNTISDLDEKFVLVIGGNSSGKTTFIQGMVNYLYGVQYTDKYRLKLVSHQENDSLTIFAYELNNTCINYRLTIVDSNDLTGAGKTTKKNWKPIVEWFRNVGAIDAVCLVKKDNLYTEEYDALLQLLGKDLAKNVIEIRTFCEFDKVYFKTLLASISTNHWDKQHLTFSNGTLFKPSNSPLEKMFWKQNAASFEYFFSVLIGFKRQTMDRTRAVMERRWPSIAIPPRGYGETRVAYRDRLNKIGFYM